MFLILSLTLIRRKAESASPTGLEADGLDVDELVLVELGEDGDVPALGHDEVVGALVGVAADALHLVRRQRAEEVTRVTRVGRVSRVGRVGRVGMVGRVSRVGMVGRVCRRQKELAEIIRGE